MAYRGAHGVGATPPTLDQLTTTKIWILEECYNGTEGEIVLLFYPFFF